MRMEIPFLQTVAKISAAVFCGRTLYRAEKALKGQKRNKSCVIARNPPRVAIPGKNEIATLFALAITVCIFT
jgi:hypothetical protein